jgi:hypothetical protein
MEEALIKSESKYSFCLDGENEMDAVLLAKTISDMAELTKIAASAENPEAYLKMNVTAFRNGSFIIDFSAICEAKETLVINAVTAASFAATIITILKGIFEIKKLLAGKKPKSISEAGDDKIEVENEDGSKIRVPKASGVIFNNIKVEQLTVNISDYAQEHNPEGGFTLSTPEGDLVCTKDDVKNISKQIPIDEEMICKRYRVDAILPIKSVDFVGRASWQFIYKGRTISARIEDDDWIETVHNGSIQIRAGDSIHVTLEAVIALDILGNATENNDSTKYTINKVHGGIIREPEIEQLLLPDIPDEFFDDVDG